LKGKIPTGSLLPGGVLLLLIISFMLITDTNLISFSNNTLSRVHSPILDLEITGDTAWDGDKGFFQYDSEKILKKVDYKGKVLWGKKLEDTQMVWMGQGGFLTNKANSVELWDSNGKLLFEKTDLMLLPRVLSAEGGFLLISGEIDNRDCTALLSKKGSIVWALAWEDDIVSGSSLESGFYTVLNLVDKDIRGRMVLINSLGEIVWNKKYPNLLLCTRVTGGGIGSIFEDKVLFMDFTGKVLWEHFFEQYKIYRADICAEGYTALVVVHQKSVLSNKDRMEIIMLSPKGQMLWSYILESPPRFVKIAKDFVYIADDDGITVLSKQGNLEYIVRQKGVTGIEVVDSSRIIVKLGFKTGILGISSGR
jgi:hypothetical protein